MKPRKYSHLLGSFKIGEAQKAVELAQRQLSILDKQGELLKGANMAYVEIRVFLVDYTPEVSVVQEKTEDKTQ